MVPVLPLTTVTFVRGAVRPLFFATSSRPLAVLSHPSVNRAPIAVFVVAKPLLVTPARVVGAVGPRTRGVLPMPVILPTVTGTAFKD